jgi:MYXO-CTERM domain-containing protein
MRRPARLIYCRIMRLTRLAALFVALLASPALAGTGEGPQQPLPDTGASAPVMGGSSVPEGKWRDTAAVLFGGQQGCTGVLIAPTVVMTAAHCIDSTLNAVLIGTNSLARPSLGETITVSRRLSYPQNKYDIAIVILAQPSTIAPRRLATGWAQSDIVNGARVQFVGYGAVDRNAQSYVDEMQEAESTVTDFNCTTHAGCDTAARPNGEIGAGGAGIDTCPGDSGGPMYLLTAYGEFLAGITSRGYDNNQYDCSEGGIYTRPDKGEIVTWVETQAQVYLPDGRGPIADKLFVQPGGENSLTVNANDVQTGRSYTWEIVTPPLHGTATIDASGKLTVMAAADYLGPDAVVVRAIDMTDPTRSARGRVEVEVVEELPEGTDDGGCCDAGNGPDGRAAPALLVLGALLLRRRRRILAA